MNRLNEIFKFEPEYVENENDELIQIWRELGPFDLTSAIESGKIKLDPTKIVEYGIS